MLIVLFSKGLHTRLKPLQSLSHGISAKVKSTSNADCTKTISCRQPRRPRTKVVEKVPRIGVRHLFHSGRWRRNLSEIFVDACLARFYVSPESVKGAL